ncbi:Hsp20/alpha crystallin family protein [Pseudomonas sp. A-1]|uniref:Hsp20/alpha crystallin family protein n=1 Tax=Pseudomonas sp. A-1 TaxID=1821274 RepID=UPI0010A655B1|nr:Hsp20/alpha crystallin family protein [Pseudomonas sp. A-1]THG86306.1 Hsp20/alpha crystallin family protein [Pseudomonas sp. A-1]
MAENEKKVAVETEEKSARQSPLSTAMRPLENLRRQVDRLFEDFDRGWHLPFSRSGFEIEPFWRRELSFAGMPAVDIIEKDDAFEITAELPGMDEKNVQVKLSNGNLTITGEKKDEREEKKKDYYLSERHYGSFQRTFGLPEGVDADKIEAQFAKGVLTLKLPKKPESRQAEKTINIKTS